MYDGVRDDRCYHIPEVSAMSEESGRGVYCANEQFDGVRNCNRIMTRYMPNEN